MWPLPSDIMMISRLEASAVCERARHKTRLYIKSIADDGV